MSAYNEACKHVRNWKIVQKIVYVLFMLASKQASLLT